MCSKQHDSFSTLKQTAKFNSSVEGNYEANRVLEVSNGESISSNTATRAPRHSASSYVPRHATEHDKAVYSNVQVTQVVTSTTIASVRLSRPRTTSLPNRPINEARCNAPDDSQDTTGTANAFVGLNRRRRTSLPSAIMLKPEQILQGGRIEVAKREINLDACVPVFTKEAERSDKKQSTTPLAKSEFSGWKREENQERLRRQRRGSLPALEVDKSDKRNFPSCSSVPAGQNDFLSPPVPRIQSGSLVGKKAEKRQWAKRV